ncbi:HAAS signaling domain-containing protein [Isoptericola sp. NPDC057653]|uniref:HAAS signaling domain-containing protein n=1 Tax=Isoptericola sp. NPDC057653 TaxID=3346195 RepID=UPI00369F3049
MTAAPAFPPLVEAYLADLERALASSDPRERAETLAAVREHAAEALALHGADDAGARRVLDELGPVDDIAAASTPAASGPGGGPAAAQAPRTPAADVWLVVLAVASLAVFVVPLVAAAAVVWAVVRLRSGTGNRGLQRLALVVGAVSFAGALALYVSHLVAAG